MSQMGQIFCPGGQCGVRNHVAGSAAAMQCGQLTAMKSRVSGMNSGRGISSSPKLATSRSSRSSWQDKGYDGEVQIDPVGCRCADCGAGKSTPIQDLTAEQVKSLISGTFAMDNRMANPLEFRVERSGDALSVKMDQLSWYIPHADDVDEDDMITKFDREGEPVYA